jgi:hypothetical protein
MATANVRVGDQAYLVEGGEEFGAVRAIGRDHLVVYVENSGDFVVGKDAVRRVHDGKVMLDPSRIDAKMREAISHAHDREDPRV